MPRATPRKKKTVASDNEDESPMTSSKSKKQQVKKSKDTNGKTSRAKKATSKAAKRATVESDNEHGEHDSVVEESSAGDDSDSYEAPSDDDESDVQPDTATASRGSKRKYDDIDSDALDESDEEIGDNYHAKTPKKNDAARSATKKSKATPAKRAVKSTPSKAKRAKKKKGTESEGLSDPDDDENDENGITVIGMVVQAPTKGRVPPGRISQNTFDFLSQLADPEYNDREWFRLHEPVFRLAEKEWVAFIEELTPLVTEMDDQIPPLPPKDLIHRIYRDVRFSNDKTPYKPNFSASMSRTGRKGIFAGYHLTSSFTSQPCTRHHRSLQPGKTFLAAGIWAPEKNELATFRSNVLADASPLRSVISQPEFVKLFGKAKPHPKGTRQNVFGREDELKTAPKGIAKTHPDIDLLKLKSVAVAHYFKDEEVLDPDFRHEVVRVMGIMRPLVHLLNDMITIPAHGESEEE